MAGSLNGTPAERWQKRRGRRMKKYWEVCLEEDIKKKPRRKALQKYWEVGTGGRQ